MPRGLNWDLWQGPREPRPFDPAYTPCNWRSFWAFGGGSLPDMGVHNLGPAFGALELDAPHTVESGSTGFDDESFPYVALEGDTLVVTAEPPWYEGRIYVYSRQAGACRG